MIRLRNFVALVNFVAVVLTVFSLPTAAVDKYYQFNLNESWHLSSSWNPFGIPTTNDRVFIDSDRTARLSSDTAAVNDLILSNGGEVRTNGFLLAVDDGTNSAGTTINDSGSRIVVTARAAGGRALDTDLLGISSGGMLDMAGGEAHVDVRAFIGEGGILAGDGLVLLFGSETFKLANNGTIRAEGGTLTIRSNGGGFFDLGGGVNGTGVLEAVDGAATLVLDGTHISDFSGTMNIGAGNTIRFDREWSTETGTINFNAAGGVGTLSGARFTHGGTMNVNAGTALIAAPNDFDNTSIINIAAGTTLDFGDNVNALHGTVFLKGGTTPATAAVIDGFSQSMFATVNVDRTAQINVPTTYFDGVTVNLNDSDDVLRLGSNSFVQNGVSFSGNGRLVNLPGSILRTEDNTSIGVPLENQGRLNIGFGDSPGELDVEGFTQTSAGTLDIDLANITPGNFDVLTIQGNANLAGTLDVSLLGGFTPLPGNSFTILETVFGVIGGTFDIEDLPIFNGLTFDVIYNSKNIVLEVVEATATGDFDGDEDVDGHDFLVWQRGGSPNGIQSGDLALWQAQYGTPLAAAANAVPEPSSVLLIALTACMASLSTRFKNY